MPTQQALKFASLVGVLSDEDHQRVLTKMRAELLDFDGIHAASSEDAKQVALQLKMTYGQEVIVDYGDEPIITEYHTSAYNLITENVIARYPVFQKRCTDLFYSVCNLAENIRDPFNDTLNKAKALRERVQEAKELMVFALMNTEIVQALYRFHFKIFSRLFFEELWTFGEKKADEFKDFFLHGILVGTAKRLKFLAEDFKKSLPMFDLHYFGPQNSLAVDKDDLPDYSDREFLGDDNEKAQIRKLMNEIEKDLGDIENLNGSNQLFLEKMAKRLPVSYLEEEQYRALYDKYNPNPLDNQEAYLADLYRLGMVLDESAPNESPVYDWIDLILVLLHTFVANTNSNGLSISAYLYAQNLKIDVGTSGVIQAAVPLGSFLFGFIWNYVTRFGYYKWPYILSIVLGIISNVVYYMAQSVPSDDPTNPNIKGIIVLVIGRLLMGISGARLMTRKYVATAIKAWAQTKFSSIFVAVSFGAICIGPGIQATIFYAPFDHVDEHGITGCTLWAGTHMCWHNMYAFIWIFVWILMLVLFIFFFTGYDKKKFLAEQNRKFNPLKVFHALDSLNVKSAAKKVAEKSSLRMKIEDLKVKQMEGSHPRLPSETERIIVSELKVDRRNSDYAFAKGAFQLLQQKTDDPFMALIEQNEIEMLNKEIGPQIDKMIEKHPEMAKSNVNQMQMNRRHSMATSIPIHRYDWRSGLHYVVYHPAAYTFYATFLLFMTKVK